MFFHNTPDAHVNVLRVDRFDTESLHHRLKFPHTWVYLNSETSSFSKIENARVNAAGYIVVGRDLNTRIVCIKNDVLTLSDHGCAEAVRFDDSRMFVFLPPEEMERRS